MRLNLQDKTLKIGVNVNPPYTFLRFDDEHNEWMATGGVEVRFMETLSQYFNFSMKYINCHRSWGSKLPNESWNGLIGLLVDQELDIGIGGISMNYDRAKALPCLYPYISNEVTFITSRPEAKNHGFMLIDAFGSTMCSLLFIVLLICFLADRLVRLYCGEFDMFWISLQLFLRQHSDMVGSNDPLDRPLNIWLIFWIFGSFVLTTVYAGCLFSMLAVPDPLDTIDTVQELFCAVESGRIIGLSIRNSYYINPIQNSYVDMFVEGGRFFQTVEDEAEGFNLVKSPGPDQGDDSYHSAIPFAFITVRDSLRYVQLIFGEEHFHLPAEDSESVLMNDLMTAFFRHNFPYVSDFDKTTKQLSSLGLIKQWRQLEYRKLKRIIDSPSNLKTSTDQIFSFNLAHMKTIYIIYFTSNSLAIIVFLIEVLWQFSKDYVAQIY